MYALNLAIKAKELKREKRKSDSLLFQMLPPSVAMQLKHTQQVGNPVPNIPTTTAQQQLIYIVEHGCQIGPFLHF